MSNIEICSFEKQYVDNIITIEELSFAIPWSKASMEQELNNKFAKYLVIKKDGVVVGYGGMWIILDEGHITNIAIHPSYRGLGLGSMLLEALINICGENKINSLTLEVRASNIVAQNLYKKFGFEKEGIRKSYYANNNEDAVIMWNRNVNKIIEP
ncbi:MAG: ribosomal protein S18-alanine N-acetyltransferase [Bacillota bacterium]|nr:ribosomal protein S18-alanine N-acetyltransferase [Bacillota bacterium]